MRPILIVPIGKEKYQDLDYPKVKPDTYEISNAGNVRNKNTGIVLKPRIINSGYYALGLYDSDGTCHNILHHRLVADVYCEGKSKERNTVNHIIGDKSNNHPWNLEWCSQKENNEHARINGLNNISCENNYQARLTNEQVHRICQLLIKGYSYKEILDDIGLDSSDWKSNNYDLIGNIRRGIAWKEISCQYDMSLIPKYTNSKYSEEQIRLVCSMIESGYSKIEIFNALHPDDTYVNSRVNKSFDEFYRGVKNKKSFKDISKDYNF